MHPGSTATSGLSIARSDGEIKRKSRSGDYLLWRMHVADAYRDAGMHEEADQYAMCSDPAQFFLVGKNSKIPSEAVSVISCSDDPNHFAKAICPSCQYRTCPDCAHREGARLLARYMPALERHFEQPKRGFRFRKIVLTTAVSIHNPDIRQHIKDLYGKVRQCFETILKERRGKQYTVKDCGFIVAHEFGPTGLKLHFHILYYGPFIHATTELQSNWLALTGWNQVRIEEVRKDERLETLSAAVAEVLKYTTKFWKRRKDGTVEYIDPKLVPLLHNILAGTRRVRSWGLFYGIQVEEEKAACETCGAAMIKLSKIEFDIWQQTGWLPEEFTSVMRAELEPNLFLKHGNKSPPGPAPPEYEQEKLL